MHQDKSVVEHIYIDDVCLILFIHFINYLIRK